MQVLRFFNPQLVPTGWPVFGLAWNSKQRILAAGGNSVLHIFKVDLTEAVRLKQARLGAQPAASSSHSSSGGVAGCSAAGASAAAAGGGPAAEVPQV